MKGSDIRVGDDLVFLGKPHRVTHITDLGGMPGWRVAWSLLPGQDFGTLGAWCMALEADGTHYEVSRAGAAQ